MKTRQCCSSRRASRKIYDDPSNICRCGEEEERAKKVEVQIQGETQLTGIERLRLNYSSNE